MINDIGIAVVCLRLILTAVTSATAQAGPVIALALGACALGYVRPKSAFMAFTALIPLLSGLGQTTLLPGTSPLLVVFACLWLGRAARRLVGAVSSTHGSAPLDLLINALISSTLISLSLQIFRHGSEPAFAHALLHMPIHAYPDPYYFLTSALVWLQGFAYLRWARDESEELHGTLGVLVAIWTTTIALFCWIEDRFAVPEAWGYGFQSPYEDISSLGSITVSLLIFSLASLRRQTVLRLLFQLVVAGALLFFVIGSYSRMTWAAGVAAGIALCWIRFPRWCTLVPLVFLGSFTIVANRTAEHYFWVSDAMLYRVLSLVKYESFAKKDPARSELFTRAIRMAVDRPVLGHGIGAFFLQGRAYGDTDSTYKVNDFAHNIVLQVAAEQGIPTAIALVFLLASALWTAAQRQSPTVGPAPPGSESDPRALQATALALAAYLCTGMTGNSLNVYVSNQFFVWFLVAVLLAARDPSAHVLKTLPGESGERIQ